MAAAEINDPRLEDFLCSVCFEVFEEPVSLPCGHTFCKSCIDSTWQGEHDMFLCPNCRACFTSRPNLQRNVVIAAATLALTGLKISNADVPPEPPKLTICDSCLDTNTQAIKICLKCEMSYCEAHVKAHEKLKGRHVMISVMGGGGLDGLKCPQHEEFFAFYCKDDKTFICMTCAMAGKHANHKVSSVENAMMEMKKKIPSEQKKVLGMKKYTSNMLKHSSRTTTEVQTSIGNMKSDIEDVQRKLTVRLAEEKAECVRELDHLEGILMGNVKTASQVFQSRLSELNHMEKKLKDFDEEKNSLAFLKDFDEFLTSVENLRKNNPDPCKTSTSLTQQSILDSYCNNLFGAMLECVYGRTPTIAESTCHANMKYSQDRTAVTATKFPQPYEDLPSRFILWGQVMASKGFHCGRHYWVVDVSKADHWSVGIAYSSLPRRKLGNEFKFGQNALSWCLYKESRCIAKSNGKEWQVSHQQGMKKVGLFLDFNLGSLIFYNAETMASLFQFRARFTEPVFPVLTVVKCDHSLGFVKLEKE